MIPKISNATNLKAFRLALQHAFFGRLFDQAMRGDQGSMDEFYKCAMAQLGIDPERTIDDELIAEAIPKLAARGIDYAECLTTIELEEEEEAIAEVGRRN